MSENIKQIYDSSPASTFNHDDLFYLGRSPYSAGNDMAAQYLSLFSNTSNQITTGSYTVGLNDINTVLTVNSSSANITINLPQQGTTVLPQGFKFFVTNIGIYDAVFSVSGSDTFYGDLSVPSGTFAFVYLAQVSGGVNNWTVSYENDGYQSFSFSGDTTLSYPVARWNDVATTASNVNVDLPDARFGVMPVGKNYYFTNTGSNTFNLNANNGTLITTINPGVTALIINKVNNTSAGSWDFKLINAPYAFINAQTGTTYTLTLADFNNTIVILNNSSPITLTIPQHSTTAIPQGSSTTIINQGFGTVTIAKQGSDTLDGNTTLLQNASCSIVNTVSGSPNTWSVLGGSTTLTYQMTLFIPTVANTTYYFSSYPPVGGTLTKIAGLTSSGTCTVNAAINGVNVTGTALSATNAVTDQSITGGNTFSGGNEIQAVVTSNSSALNLQLTLWYTVTI